MQFLYTYNVYKHQLSAWLKLTLIPKQSQENLSPFTKDFCVSEYYNESYRLIFSLLASCGLLIKRRKTKTYFIKITAIKFCPIFFFRCFFSPFNNITFYWITTIISWWIPFKFNSITVTFCTFWFTRLTRFS